MKRFACFITSLLVVSMILGLMACKEPDIEPEKSQTTPSGSETIDPSKNLILDFNGGSIGNVKLVSFKSEEIEDYVEMPIDKALDILGVSPRKTGCKLLGWTTTRDGNKYRQFLPANGTLYAKWESNSAESTPTPSVPSVTLTLDFNGGKVGNDTSITLVNETLQGYKNKLISETLTALNISNPTKEGGIFLGWTLTKNGEDYVSIIPSIGEFIYYAKWGEAIDGTVTLITRGMDTFYNTEEMATFSELNFEFKAGETLENVLARNGYNYSTMVKGYDANGREYVFDCFIDEKNYRFESDKILSGSVTIYPSYKKVPQVIFNFNDGCAFYKDSMNPFPSEDEFIMIIPFGTFLDSDYIDFFVVRDGYMFVGWTLTKDGDDIVNTVDEDVILYAKWQSSLNLFDNGDIVGDFTVDENGYAVDGVSLEYKGNGIYTYKFTYDSETMNIWGSKKGTIAFKFRPIAHDWSVSYGTILEQPLLNGKEVEFGVAVGEGSNLVVSGLVDGAEYLITVKCTQEGRYFVKIEGKVNDVIEIPSEGSLTFTLDAGKGSFICYNAYSDEVIMRARYVSMKVNPGDSMGNFNINGSDIYFEPYCEFNEEKGFWYAYEEDGVYYDSSWEFIDDTGKLIDGSMDEVPIFYKDTTWTLLYRKIVGLTFNLNGGYVDDYENNMTFTGNVVEYKIEGSFIDDYFKRYSRPKKDNYVFMGWTLTPNGEDNVTTYPNKDTMIYAKWEPVSDAILTLYSGDYSGIYDKDGNLLGSNVTLSFRTGSSLHEALEENNIDSYRLVKHHELNGKNFAGFVDLDGNEFYTGEILKKSITLYCKSRVPYPDENKYNYIILDYNDGYLLGNYYYSYWTRYDDEIVYEVLEGHNSDCRYESILSVFYTELKKENYFVNAWTYTRDGDDYVDVNSYIPIGTNVTIYPKWSKVQTATLTIDSRGTYEFYDYDTSERYTKLELTFETGMTFGDVLSMYNISIPDGYQDITGRWYHNDGLEDLDGNIYYRGWEFYHKVLSESLFLYLNFSLVPRITYVLNGGNVEGNYSDVVRDCNEYIFYYEPRLEGHVLQGWTLTQNGCDFVGYTDEDIIVYAKWAPTEQSFDNGGIVLDVSDNDKENDIILPFESQGDGIYSVTFTYDYNKFGDVLNFSVMTFIEYPYALRFEGYSYKEWNDLLSLDGPEMKLEVQTGIIAGWPEGVTDGKDYTFTVRCIEEGIFLSLSTAK